MSLRNIYPGHSMTGPTWIWNYNLGLYRNKCSQDLLTPKVLGKHFADPPICFIVTCKPVCRISPGYGFHMLPIQKPPFDYCSTKARTCSRRNQLRRNNLWSLRDVSWGNWASRKHNGFSSGFSRIEGKDCWQLLTIRLPYWPVLSVDNNLVGIALYPAWVSRYSDHSSHDIRPLYWILLGSYSHWHDGWCQTPTKPASWTPMNRC